MSDICDKKIEDICEKIEDAFRIAGICWFLRLTIDRLFALYCVGEKTLAWLKKRAQIAFQIARVIDFHIDDPKAFAILEKLATGEGDSFQQYEDHPLMRFHRLRDAISQDFQYRKKRKQLREKKREQAREIDAIFSAKPI